MCLDSAVSYRKEKWLQFVYNYIQVLSWLFSDKLNIKMFAQFISVCSNSFLFRSMADTLFTAARKFSVGIC